MAKRSTKKDALVAQIEKLGLPNVFLKYPEGHPNAGQPIYHSEEQLQLILDMQGKTIKTKKAKEETVDQIRKRIQSRFDVLDTMTHGAFDSAFNSLIVSGPPGLGKSFGVEKVKMERDANDAISASFKGRVSAAGLFKQLWDHRHPGNVLILDDADNVFQDESALNLLKAALDSKKKGRKIAWLTESNFVSDKDGSAIPKFFDFEGAVIFITNLDFVEIIKSGGRFAPHMEAMHSRSHYIDLELKTNKDYIVRLEMIFEEGLLSEMSTEDKKEIMDFMSEYQDHLNEISARMAIKLADLMKFNRKTWKKIAQVTCFKTT